MNAFSVNVTDRERLASALAGAALATLGLRRRSAGGALLAAGGLALVARGTTGHCPAYAAVGRNDVPGRRPVTGPGTVLVDESVTIRKPAQELYALWRSLQRLPEFFPELRSVTTLDDRRSRWAVSGPANSVVEWEASIAKDEPNGLIAWETTAGSEVRSRGSVRFIPVQGKSETEVHVTLRYEPPAGKAGAVIAWLSGRSAGQLVREGLRRFKSILETGEAPTTAGQPHGQTSLLNYD